MSWLKLDDGFADHPKLVRLGPPAHRWAFLELMLYCAKHRTDGYFPTELVTKKMLARYVEVGLVDDEGEGHYRIHDWPQFNPTKDPTGATRQQRWRNAKRNGDSNGESNAPVTENVTDEVTSSRARDPVPSLSSEEANASSRTTPGTELATVTALPAAANAQTLVGYFVEQSCELGGSIPPSRVKGQVAREIKGLVDDGCTDKQIRAGLDLLLEKRLHPSTLASLVHEASLPKRGAKRGRMTPTEILARAQQMHAAEEAMFNDAG